MVKPVDGNDRKNQDFLPVALAENTGEAKIKVTIKVPTNENHTVCCKGTFKVTDASNIVNPQINEVFQALSQMPNCKCTIVHHLFFDPNDSRIE